jgi:hypothetical protein
LVGANEIVMGVSAPKKDLPQIYTAIARKWKLEKGKWSAKALATVGGTIRSVLRS